MVVMQSKLPKEPWIRHEMPKHAVSELMLHVERELHSMVQNAGF